MLYYIGNIGFGTELYHHGIKGQKWGIRRFQNKDGSLKKRGMSRYRTGRSIAKEYNRIQNDEHERLRKNSRSYTKASKEIARLREAYNLDILGRQNGESPEGFDNDARRANDRIWNKQEDMDILDQKFIKKAEEYANKEILKKYGNTGLSDMQHYNKRRAQLVTAAVIGAVGGFMLYANSIDKKYTR